MTLAWRAKPTRNRKSDDVTWGTPYYVAPEKIKREPETFLSDMYSLGATLYHALTGHVPFDAPTAEEVIVAQVQTPLTPPNLVVPGNHAADERRADAGAGQKSGEPVFKLRRIPHGAGSGAQPVAGQTIPGSAAENQEPDQLVEAVIKKRALPPA